MLLLVVAILLAYLGGCGYEGWGQVRLNCFFKVCLRFAGVEVVSCVYRPGKHYFRVRCGRFTPRLALALA